MNQLADKIIGGYRFKDVDELLAAAENTPREELYEACHEITRKVMGDGFDTCSIINVKSGNCPEDCAWCTQSAHYRTDSEVHGVLPVDRVRDQALFNESQGIGRFSLVASGKRPNSRENAVYGEMFDAIRERGGQINLCASLGLATREQLQALKDAGCTTYHCNMESAPSYFPTLVSTHTQEQKEETLRNARAVGMRACSGGIIGMGETRRQRAEFALYLASLGIGSIPINFLHPMAGTPLGGRKPLDDDELLLSICLFRLANPEAYLRFSGGRALYGEETQRKALYIGINAAITGDLLTTKASVTESDMRLFAEAGYDAGKETTWTE